MAHGIPHQIFLSGKKWRIRWGNPDSDDWRPKSDWGQLSYAEREITLHPTLRLKENKAQAWATLVHEIMHAVAPRRFTHKMIHMIDEPLGNAFVDMGVVIQCCCRACVKARTP